MRTGAVIAAAGMSSRMHSFKPLLQLGGSTIIRIGITSLQSAGVQEITVITGNNSDQLSKHLAPTGVTCIYNSEYKTTDMLYSAIIGFEHIVDKCDRVFFLPADIPLFSRESLLAMLREMDKTRCKVLMPIYGEKPGHPVLIDCSVIPEIIQYTGELGLMGAIRKFSGEKGYIKLDDIGITLDADRPEDYENLKKYLRKKTMETPIRCDIKVSISRRREFFDLTLCRLLRGVEKYHSLHRVCEEMDMSYSKGWSMVKIAEHQLGFLLLDSKVGGQDGGGSKVTEKGIQLIQEYERLLLRVEKLAKQIFLSEFSLFTDNY